VKLEDYENILYMKVGTHAQEDLAEIFLRKKKEIEDEGFSMWGYGGNTCHPTTMVQPFALASPGPIVLAMQPMESLHYAVPVRAEQYSVNGIDWLDIPAGINVLGSRYALCIDSLDEVDWQLDLGRTEVAVGRSRGRSGDEYVKGRVDKACLSVAASLHSSSAGVDIKLAGRLVTPYAVFLRS
jgi:hypothetical protein